MNVYRLPRRVAIVGSRAFPDPDKVRHLIRRLPYDTIVVTGDADAGVDVWVREEARALGLVVEVYEADWKTHGRRAGFLRNGVVVENSEFMFAFWDEVSPGTADAAYQAQSAGLPVVVVRADSEVPMVEAGDR